MNNSIQQRLRGLREGMGISQEKLASELDVTRMTIAGYELGKRPPDSTFIMKACRFFDCTPDYIFGISPFKNDKHYSEWISSADTLQLSLNTLPEKAKNDLITALNWLLQDNYAVNQLTSDNNYMIDKFINLIISYTDIFRTFSSTVTKANVKTGIEEFAIFDFYKYLDKNKKELINNIECFSSDLFGYLIRHSKKEIEKSKIE